MLQVYRRAPTTHPCASPRPPLPAPFMGERPRAQPERQKGQLNVFPRVRSQCSGPFFRHCAELARGFPYDEETSLRRHSCRYGVWWSGGFARLYV